MAHRALPGLGVAGDGAPGVAVGLVWVLPGKVVALTSGCGELPAQAARRKATNEMIKTDFE